MVVGDSAEVLLGRAEQGPALTEPGLLAALDELPAELLRSRLEGLGGHPGCNLAYLLARRQEPRGVAALARFATELSTAARAIRYLRELDMMDMVPPAFREPESLAHAEIVELLGSAPDWLEEDLVAELPWPGLPVPVLVNLYRFQFPGQPVGLAMVGPARVRIDGGIHHLDRDDRLALACGRSQSDRFPPLDPAGLPRELASHIVRRRAYLYLTDPVVERCWDHGTEQVIVVACRRRGERGYLVGGAHGDRPIHWIEAPPGPHGDTLDADGAYWLWLGRMLLAGA